MHKSVILIAVRMKSKRLPNKALAVVEGQTITEHLIDRMKKSKNADKVILCTSTHPDDAPLLEVAEKKGIYAFAGDELDVMKRFIDAVQVHAPDADIVVRVTGDNPLTSPYFIDNAIEHHIKTKADYTSTSELPQGTKGEVISLSALKKAFELAENSKFSEYMTWYFTKNPEFFKMEKAPVDEDMKRPHYRFTVDNPEDLELIKAIYKKLYTPGKIIPLKDAIKFVDDNPELAKINENVKGPDVQINVKLKKRD